MVNIDVTGKDLRNYRLINGSVQGSLIGKSRQPSSQRVSSLNYPLGHLFLLRSRRKEGAISHLGRVSNGAHRRPLTSSRPLSKTLSISTSLRVIQLSFYAPTARRIFLRAKTSFNLSEFPCSASARAVISSRLRGLSAPSKTSTEPTSSVWGGLIAPASHRRRRAIHG